MTTSIVAQFLHNISIDDLDSPANKDIIGECIRICHLIDANRLARFKAAVGSPDAVTNSQTPPRSPSSDSRSDVPSDSQSDNSPYSQSDSQSDKRDSSAQTTPLQASKRQGFGEDKRPSKRRRQDDELGTVDCEDISALLRCFTREPQFGHQASAYAWMCSLASKGASSNADRLYDEFTIETRDEPAQLRQRVAAVVLGAEFQYRFQLESDRRKQDPYTKKNKRTKLPLFVKRKDIYVKMAKERNMKWPTLEKIFNSKIRPLLEWPQNCGLGCILHMAGGNDFWKTHSKDVASAYVLLQQRNRPLLQRFADSDIVVQTMARGMITKRSSLQEPFINDFMWHAFPKAFPENRGGQVRSASQPLSYDLDAELYQCSMTAAGFGLTNTSTWTPYGDATPFQSQMPNDSSYSYGQQQQLERVGLAPQAPAAFPQAHETYGMSSILYPTQCYNGIFVSRMQSLPGGPLAAEEVVTVPEFY